MRKSRILFSALAATLLAAAMFAQSKPASGDAARFTFKPANAEMLTEDKGPLDVVITQWSPDSDRDKVFAEVMEKGADALLGAIASTKTVGYIHLPMQISYTLVYAKEASNADGTRDLVLVTQPKAWLWWDKKADLPTEQNFSVIQVRFDKSGRGEAKISNGGKIAADKKTGVVIENFNAQPLLFTDFKQATS